VLVLSHLYPSTALPGAGPFVRDEVVELAKRHTMAVVSPVLWDVQRLDERRRVAAVPAIASEDGIRVSRPRLVRMPPGARFLEPWFWAFRLRPFLRRMWNEIDGDLVHAHYALPDGFAAARYTSRKEAPLVLTLWGSDVLEPGFLPIARRYLAHTLSQADAIIAVSEELAKGAERFGADAARIRVIPGGVAYLPRESRDMAREHVGLANDATCVAWAGSLIPRKQPLKMLKAFETFVAGGHDDAVLTMIGEGPLRKDVTDYIREQHLRERVRLLGHLEREEVWRWQCAADLFVNSSLIEGTPLTVLEALGAGTRVAGYPLPGVEDAVRAVRGGCIAESGSPTALAAAMATALEDAGDRDALAADAQARFAIERTARDIEAVYSTVS